MTIEEIKKAFSLFSKKYIIELFFLVLSVGLILGSIAFFTFAEKNRAEVASIPVQASVKEPKPSITETKHMIVVYIAGAVENPDVYEIPEGERFLYALKQAGGITKDADSSFFSRNFNLAQILTDQEKFYIPTKAEVAKGVVMGVSTQGTGTTAGSPSKISINTASSSELESLPGIGEVTAEKIISLRPYATLDDLVAKKVVGQSVYGKIKELITL